MTSFVCDDANPEVFDFHHINFVFYIISKNQASLNIQIVQVQSSSDDVKTQNNSLATKALCVICSRQVQSTGKSPFQLESIVKLCQNHKAHHCGAQHLQN